MRTASVALVAATLVIAGCASTPSPDLRDAALAQLLSDALPDGSSGTLVTARGADLLHCAGFGLADREAGIAATCDTAYDIMSMTKQFTAAAVLRLEMAGSLSLRDEIGTYFPEAPADKLAISIHQLLTHTAGLVESVGDDYDPLTRDELVTRAMASELIATPGEEHHYSNVGYSLLAAIIEIITGTSYEQFLADELFAPAGMMRTGYVLPEWDAGQVAIEYDENGKPQGRPFDHPWAADGPYWNLRGNGGLISTARDMFRWHLALRDDAILDKGAKARLFEPYVAEEPGADSFYGYGWAIQESAAGTIATHDGGNDFSFGELTRLLDKDLFVFWATNQTFIDGVDLSESNLTGKLIELLID